MVLGLRSKHKKDTAASVKVDYIVTVQEIRPWPPSESLRRVSRVLLQWADSTKNYGSFLSDSTSNSNVASFNDSFKLSLTFRRERKSHHEFQKNILEFSLFEPRKDSSKNKGQLLGTALVNLAEYGVIEDVLSISCPIILKKSSSSSVQPSLVVDLEPVERVGSTSSHSKEPSLSNDDNLSEIASFTDDEDDVSPHSASSFKDEKHREKAHEFVSPSNLYERSKPSLGRNRDVSYVRTSTSSSMAFPDRNGKSELSEATFSVQEHIPKEYHQSIDSLSSETPIPENIGHSSSSVDSLHSIALREKELSSEAVSANGDSPLESLPSVGETSTSKIMTETDEIKNVSANSLSIAATEEKESKENEVADCNNEWRKKIEMLEDELRETAAIEISLYTVAAEHSSSANKVHTPARRLSRFYAIACKSGSQNKRSSAARAVVSGLVLVSKACGNDVPRLTFWFSNLIMLRSIVSQTVLDFQNSVGLEINRNASNKESGDEEDIQKFINALEKVESWLFSRVVESLWWQTFTPHMQPSVAKQAVNTSAEPTKKSYGRRIISGNQEMGNFSVELWKKAFKDACEKLCPIRAVGHDCGCLSVLVRLVMEQLVDRLDIAMFNAVLRESDEEMPTDPLSDPISDSKVLPIPAGKSSFGAGVALKNTIGCWSRHLTDLFGLEDESTDFRAFRLLHALSDLMMIPFGMLPDVPTRKEICPNFGPTIVKRVLSSFVPDEFCPNPVPRAIIDSLDTEEVSSDASQYQLTTLPFASATPTAYSPPSAALLVCVGEVGSQVLKSSRLSSLKKSYTSDDELDALDSPLASIVPTEGLGGEKVVRYHLLREIWKDD